MKQSRTKKLAILFLSMIVMLSAVAIPVSAKTIAEPPGYAIEELCAKINGGATVSSQSAMKKTDRDSMYFNARSATADGWNTSGNEWVWFRGRSASGTVQVTEAALKNYYGSLVEDYLTYLYGYGSVGSYYRIAIEYDNENPYEYVVLDVGWAP